MRSKSRHPLLYIDRLLAYGSLFVAYGQRRTTNEIKLTTAKEKDLVPDFLCTIERPMGLGARGLCLEFGRGEISRREAPLGTRREVYSPSESNSPQIVGKHHTLLFQDGIQSLRFCCRSSAWSGLCQQLRRQLPIGQQSSPCAHSRL